MSDTLPVVKCAACGQQLEETAIPKSKRAPCPNCGSTDRAFEMHLSSTLSFHSKIGLKARNPKSRKPFHEQVSGDDLFRLTGQWNKLKRIVDRARNYYLEVITDPKTGSMIRYCEEPLSKHRSRGSAKKTGGKSDA